MSASIHSPHLRRSHKSIEQKALEAKATPILLALADKRLRTEARTASSTILGTQFQTSLPAGLALYRQLVAVIQKMGLAANPNANSVMKQQRQQQLQQQEQNSGNIISNTPPPSPPLTPSGAEQQPANNTSNNLSSSFSNQQQQLSSSSSNVIIGTQAIPKDNPYGLLPTDSPMVAQGKILEAWAAFLGGEKRKRVRVQAKLAQQSTAAIAKAYEARNPHMFQQQQQDHHHNHSSEDQHHHHSPDNNTNKRSDSPSNSYYFLHSSTSPREDNNNNNNAAQTNASSSLGGDNQAQQQQDHTLLCDVAVPGIEYPSVILDALRVEESERNPRAELELFCQHYEDIMNRGQASNQGTIRELETSVFVTLTQSLLNLVHLAAPRPNASKASSGFHGGGSSSQTATGSKHHHQLKRGGQKNMSSRPGTANSNISTQSSSYDSRAQTPVDNTTATSGRISQQYQQQQQQPIFRPPSSSAARPTSATSSLATMAQPAATPYPLYQQQGGGRPPSGATGSTTSTPSPPPQIIQQQSTTTPSDLQQQQQQGDLMMYENSSSYVPPNTTQASNSTLTIARAVCRPNSAAALTARRKKPNGLDQFMQTSSKLAVAQSARDNRELMFRQQQEREELERQGKINPNQNENYYYENEQQQQQQQQQEIAEIERLGSSPGTSRKFRPPTAPTQHQQQQHQQQQQSASIQPLNRQQNRTSASHLWKDGTTDATVGVGAAGVNVAPTTHANWSFGHKSFTTTAKVDTKRPRHGPAVQTQNVSSRIVEGSSSGTTMMLNQHRNHVPRAPGHVGVEAHDSVKNVHGGSHSWNQYQENERWVLSSS